MPADDGTGLDKGKVTTPIGGNLGESCPKCPIRWPESRSLGCPLKHIELMAKGEVFEGELSAGSEGGLKCEKDDFEHPNMLDPSQRNSNDTNPDGLFRRDRGSGRSDPNNLELVTVHMLLAEKVL
jgi:hypothetical protein